MSMKMMNAAYLVDNAALLSLQEKQDGVEFHCFDMDSKVQIAEGHIGWDVLDKQPFSTLEESARMAALQKVPQLVGLAIAPVAPEMMEQVRGGRKVLWQMKKADPELENAKNIRFITSSYEDRFKIPDGSAVEIEYPSRKFSARCEYMDEYHLRLGYDVLHICQLAEMPSFFRPVPAFHALHPIFQFLPSFISPFSINGRPFSFASCRCCSRRFSL